MLRLIRRALGRPVKGERASDSDVNVLRASDRSAIARSVGRYPGPVWTMIACLIALAVNAALVLTLHVPSPFDPALTIGVAVITLACIAVLLGFAERTPTDAILGIAIIADICVTALVLQADSPTDAIINSFGYLAVGLYVAYWFSRRQATLIAVMSSTVYLWALFFHGYLPGLVGAWTMLVTINFGAALMLTSLIRELQDKAMVDPLTGLLNRVGFESHIVDNGRASRAASPRQVVLIDLDGFKEINDTHGHEAGDEVLRELGYAWRHSLRKGDIAVRSGGDEFVLVLPHTSERVARRIVERLRDASPIGFSVGIADWPLGVSFDAVSLVADKRLYAEKAARKGQSQRAAEEAAQAEQITGTAPDPKPVEPERKPLTDEEWGNY